jgi:three-Cys-motif partner protein
VKSIGTIMSERVQPFGGEHTRRKLDVVAKYLAAYVTVMKRQDFRLYYVDGFAGSGASTSKAEAERSQDPTLFPAADVLDGSPIRALSVEPPFDHYILIEKREENVRSLSALQEKFSDRSIEIAPGDANQRLGEFCDRISNRRLNRAVVFLDPFGLSVRWETVQRLAATRKVDLWYLVPVDGMSRQIKDDGTFLPGASKIDEIWGSAGWRAKAVRRIDNSNDLFGTVDERLEKIAKAKQFSEMFRDHLRDAFAGGVASAYLPLGRGRRHDFSLMFACANPSPAASGTAMRIANHILRTA